MENEMTVENAYMAFELGAIISGVDLVSELYGNSSYNWNLIQVLTALRPHRAGYRILITTSIKESKREEVKKLIFNFMGGNEDYDLLMRADDDNRDYMQIKNEWFHNGKIKYPVRMFFERSNAHADMWRGLGLNSAQV
ncbi:hypothetical protein [Chromobacterium sp. Panama]|uniref:phosphatase domain-containing protein n=1 Tax=Chromobacterium sp. Panama TaxID=2161826 RepID=UPI0011B2358F|nr:hypothetical protein [Chromobacterium sp. Panama]